jgi:hypothetical protein
MKVQKVAAASLWVLLFFVYSPALARPWLVEPDNSLEFRQFLTANARLAGRGYERAARDQLLAYARAHEGTDAGGTALLSAANLTYSRLGDQATGQALFEEACQKYKASLIEVGARTNRATWDRNATGDSVAYVAAMSEISVDLGGPSVQEVLAAGEDTSTLAAQVRSLHPEAQLGIWHVYKNIFYEYKATNSQQALAIARFGRTALEPAALPGDEDYSLFLADILMEQHDISGAFGSVPSKPIVTVLAPPRGSIVPPSPTLQLRITTGDYRYTTVDLTRLKLQVDGVDRSFEPVVKSDLDLSFTQGVDFETLTVSLPTTLQPGSHWASVFVARTKVASDAALPPEGQTIDWSFTVSEDQPPSPTTQTLSVAKDAMVYERAPHSNEGANPVLTLEKISGKASRDLLGFPLENISTSGLTKATPVRCDGCPLAIERTRIYESIGLSHTGREWSR